MTVYAFAKRGLATGKGTKIKGPPGQQKMPELSDYVKVPTVRAMHRLRRVELLCGTPRT